MKLAPGLGTTGSQRVVYTAPAPGAGKAAIPNTSEFHSKVSLRLAAAANRTVIPASASPDSDSPLTLNRRAISTEPQHLAVEAGIQQARLSWEAPSWKGAGIDFYLLTYQPGDVSLVFDSMTSTTTIKDLKGDTEYLFTLWASNPFGDSLPTSKRSTIQSPPPPPPPAPIEVAAPAPVHNYVSNSHIISGVPYIRQSHNLSCEEATTSMALHHQGLNVSQDQILAALGVDNTPVVMSGGLVVSWGNPDRAFVGNVNGLESNHTGYQANPKALMRVINSFGGRVIEWGEPGVAGYISPQEIYAQVQADHPVVAYGTWDWRYHTRHDYRSEDGNMVAWIGPYDAHVYTVVGVNSGSVLVNDPLRGQYWVSKGSFEAAYSDFNMAIVFA
ncbi:MAG: C39 family peptidase [Candidatus Dormibacteraeota bacterium]|nr:C39 family peptidase [Candidatus Dormibacteraeota bacterium]